MERFQSGLFRQLAAIYMIQALVFSITGIVDSAIVGQFWGAEGLAGMKLAMPVFSVLYMFGSVFSTGLSVQVSKLLAKGKRAEANQCFIWVCIAVSGICLFFMTAAAFFPDKVTDIFAEYSDGADLYNNAKAYLIPVMIGSLPVVMQNVLSGVAALDGANKRLALSVAAVLVSDVIGDFFAVMLGAGIRGIAIASVVAYLCACLVLIRPLAAGETLFRFRRPCVEKGMLAAVMIAGIPMAVQYVCDFICAVAANSMMLRYGSVEGLAALSIQDALRYLPMAFGDGIMAATLLLTGMYAAEHDTEALRRERKDIFKYSVLHGSVWALVLAAAAPLLVRMFTRDAALREMGTYAFCWFLAGVPFMSVNFAARSYMQGLGRQKTASVLTMINQLVLPVVIIWMLGRRWGISGIFSAFAVHEIILTICIICLVFIVRKSGRSISDAATIENLIAEIRGDITSEEQAAEASERLIRLCEDNGVDRKQAFNMGLCLEELAVNSLQHGFKDDREKYVEYRLLIAGQWLILRLRDNGRPFDLTERYKILNPDDPLSGIGLKIIFSSAENVNYSHAFDMNNVCIRIPKQSSR